MDRAGFEPAASALRRRRSTLELPALSIKIKTLISKKLKMAELLYYRGVWIPALEKEDN